MANGKAVGIIVVLVVLGFLFLSYKGSSLGTLGTSAAKIVKPSEVTVSGTASTTGTGTYPQKITFTSLSDGSTYVASVSNTGSYQTTLPNVNQYSIQITYAVVGVTAGSCSAGTLNLDTFDSSTTDSVGC